MIKVTIWDNSKDVNKYTLSVNKFPSLDAMRIWFNTHKHKYGNHTISWKIEGVKEW